MEPVKAEIKVGETTTVLAKQTGDLVVNTQASYVSSDESIATVDNTGKVTITGKFGDLVAGTTKVTVKSSINVSEIPDQKAESVKTGMYISLILISLILIFSPIVIKRVKTKNRLNNI